MSDFDDATTYTYSSTKAKKEYFLSTDDIRYLPYRPSDSPQGPRSARYYNPDDLEKTALMKYGAKVLAKKRAHRVRNEEKQRRSAEAKKRVGLSNIPQNGDAKNRPKNSSAMQQQNKPDTFLPTESYNCSYTSDMSFPAGHHPQCFSQGGYAFAYPSSTGMPINSGLNPYAIPFVGKAMVAAAPASARENIPPSWPQSLGTSEYMYGDQIHGRYDVSYAAVPGAVPSDLSYDSRLPVLEPENEYSSFGVPTQQMMGNNYVEGAEASNSNNHNHGCNFELEFGNTYCR